MFRRVDLMEAVIPGSSDGLSLHSGILSDLSPMDARCLRSGLVDRNPMDFRSASCDIVIACGSAELTLSTGEGMGIFTGDVADEGLC